MYLKQTIKQISRLTFHPSPVLHPPEVAPAIHLLLLPSVVLEVDNEAGGGQDDRDEEHHHDDGHDVLCGGVLLALP